MGPILPKHTNQSFEKLASTPPQVNTTQQTGATTPTQPTGAQSGKTQETSQSLSKDAAKEVVQHKSSDYNPVQDSSDKDTQKLENSMSSPKSLSELDKKLSDADPNDTVQVRKQMLDEVRSSLGDDKAKDFMRKLSSTKMVPDPANPGKQIQQGKLYERMIQSYISDYKNAPPEKRAEALQNLTHLLATGAVKVLNDDDNC